MTTILMVRHGQSTANLNGLFAGRFDAELTELGHLQARRTAEFVVKTYQVDAVYASPLRRAYCTGEHIAALAGIPITPEPGLQEIFAGNWEGQPFTQLGNIDQEAYHCWTTDIGNSRCPKGESVAELAQRVWETVTRIARENEGKTVVLATHATPVRAVQWKMSGQPLSHMQSIPWASNASVTELRYEDGILTPVHISQDAHLADLKTYLPPNV